MNMLLPEKINWRITYKCNSHPKCKFCYAPFLLNQLEDISLDICEIIIKNAPKLVVIAGGEPTEHPNLFEIMKRLHQAKIKICLATNGINLLRIMPDFYKYVDIITLPIEGTLQTHSYLRNPESYNSVIEILEYLKAHAIHEKFGLNVFINTVCLNQNMLDFPFIAHVINSYQIEVWKIFEYIHYDGINIKRVTQIDNTYLEYLRSLLKNNSTILRYECSINRTNRYFMINPDGTVVVPCVFKQNTFIDREIGSLLENYDKVISEWHNIIDNNNYTDANQIFKLS